MLIYYIRHGEAIYDPDSLSSIGHEQAKALSKRLSKVKFDEVYISTNIRAQQTAAPTLAITGNVPVIKEWLSEDLAWKDFAYDFKTGRDWFCHNEDFIELLNSDEALKLGEKWFEAPCFREFPTIKAGINRVNKELDDLLMSLGYKHERAKKRYISINDNDKKIAIFAHQGFSTIFFSSLLDIPYNVYSTRFDVGFSSMSVIELKANKNGIAYPKVLQLSNDSHLYKEGMSLIYNKYIEI